MQTMIINMANRGYVRDARVDRDFMFNLPALRLHQGFNLRIKMILMILKRV